MPEILTYDQLIKETDSGKVYLAEIEPAKKMSGWQLAAGQSNTYQVTVDPGMVVVNLKEEKTFLTLKNSVAEVESNSGTWYFDSSTEVLYTHASDSVDPDTHYMTAYFLLVFATHPRVFNGRFYQPKIAGIPEFRQSVNEKKAGNTIQSSGRLTLLEDSEDPFWSAMLYTYNWLNKRVTIKLGGSHDDYPYAEFKTVARWILKGNVYTDTEVQFEAADLKSLLKNRIGVNRYDLVTYPNLDPDAEGKVIQIAYGQITNGRAVLVDSTVGTGGKWKLAGHVIDSITAVYDDGVSVSYTADLANGEFTLNVAASGRITADFTGIKDNGVYLKKGGEIAKHILLNFLPLKEEDIVASDFDALDTARNYTLAIYIEKATRVDEIFSIIENSDHCFFYTDRETGKIGVKIFADPDPNDAARIFLNDDNLFGFEIETDETIAHEINVTYGNDFDREEDKQVQKIDLQSSYINDAEEGKTVETYLVSKSDAESLADILLPFYSKPRLLVKAETPIRPLDRNLYDNVDLNRQGRPAFSDGIYVYRLIGFREKAGRTRKRVTLTLSRNLQAGE
ncbi:MAG: hypothetical protein ACE5EK_00360 [Nitrospinales bacterium]